MHRNEGLSVDRSTGVYLFKTTPPYSVCSPEFLNSLQEELMNIITQAGLPILDQAQDTRNQLWTALSKISYLSGNLGIGKTPAYRLELSTDSAGKPSSNTWTVVSDIRVKKDIRPFTDGLSIILKLEPKKFYYNGKAGFKSDKENIGFIAQDGIKTAPYLFGTYKTKLNETDKEETELLNYNGHPLSFILVNSIQEQQIIIEKQQETINSLVKRIEKLEALCG
jgi:hypothetical protein